MFSSFLFSIWVLGLLSGIACGEEMEHVGFLTFSSCFSFLFFFFFYLFFFFPSQMEMPIRGRSAFLSFSSPLRSGGRKERPRDPPPPPLPQKNRAATGRLLDEINGREWRGGSGLWLKGLFLGAFGTD